MLRYLWLSVAVVVFDQLSKWWAVSELALGESRVLIPHFFNLTLVHNYGAAFGMLAQAGGWQRFLFGGIAALAAAVITAILRRLRPGAGWVAVALGLILGGAIGNLIDRIYLGYVIDFADVYWRTHHWPAFNLADSAITIGAVMLVIDTFRRK
ncbi:MAG: signal peptidase II [Pseudomonadota bacterium]|uniref:signal peptidase II n=1 Tax=Thermithiobacillus tepidarius TaxID=929 RepID=UPI00041840F9|nr:signal peptidase II [Thermithiobacillus tepidarius]